MLGVALLVQVIFHVSWKRWVNRTYYAYIHEQQQRVPQRERQRLVEHRQAHVRQPAHGAARGRDGKIPAQAVAAAQHLHEE